MVFLRAGSSRATKSNNDFFSFKSLLTLGLHAATQPPNIDDAIRAFQNETEFGCLYLDIIILALQ